MNAPNTLGIISLYIIYNSRVSTRGEIISLRPQIHSFINWIKCILQSPCPYVFQPKFFSRFAEIWEIPFCNL
jgi:hypothetical protein